MMQRFQDKTVVVTAGGGGIGAATCRPFAAEGARVAVFDLKLEAAEKIAAAIRAQGARAQAARSGVVAETGPSLALTDIEQELLVWLASGRSNSEIARCRSRSPATIRNQLHALYAKLDVCGRAEAVAVAARLPRQIAAPSFGSNDPWTSDGGRAE